MSSEKVEVHSVTWDGDRATFRCSGDRSSSCHRFPDCECEQWSEDHNANHPMVEHDAECWQLPWLENVDVECTYVDDEGEHVLSSIPRHDAPIETEWDGDGLLWRYADDDLNASAFAADLGGQS